MTNFLQSDLEREGKSRQGVSGFSPVTEHLIATPFQRSGIEKIERILRVYALVSQVNTRTLSISTR
jgi:hypothetical protein